MKSICDSITRIMNGYERKMELVDVINSKFVKNVLIVLKKQGYINDFELLEKYIRVRLRYWNNSPVIKSKKFISRPSRRIYSSATSKQFIPFHTFGILIVSTNKGVMTSSEARERGIGGQVLMEIF